MEGSHQLTHCLPQEKVESQTASAQWGCCFRDLGWFWELTIWITRFSSPPHFKFLLLRFKFTNEEWACENPSPNPNNSRTLGPFHGQLFHLCPLSVCLSLSVNLSPQICFVVLHVLCGWSNHTLVINRLWMSENSLMLQRWWTNEWIFVDQSWTKGEYQWWNKNVTEYSTHVEIT